MREALRVLRDLYSARHYCRSFVPRVRISSPPPSPAYSTLTAFLLRLFCSSSSSLFLLFLLLPPFTALLHSRLLCYRHNGRQWGLRGNDCRFRILRDIRMVDMTVHFSITLQHLSLFVLSTFLFDNASSNDFIYTRNCPYFLHREIVRSIIIESLIIVLLTYHPHRSRRTREESLFKKLLRNLFIIQRCVAKRGFSPGVLPFILIKRSSRDSFFQETRRFPSRKERQRRRQRDNKIAG